MYSMHTMITYNLIINIINVIPERSFVTIDSSTKLRQYHWKESLKISKTTKF